MTMIMIKNAFSRYVEAMSGRAEHSLPSPVARDLVRRLLRPKRTLRPEAEEALKHPWFRAPPLEPGDQREDDAHDPLLQWADFEDGFAAISREFQRKAQEMVEAVGEIQIGINLPEPHIQLDLQDDRMRKCVVCYQSSGHFGFYCDQCYHSVCIGCLVKLPKPECPHCRKPASDVAAAQHLAKVAENFDAKAALQVAIQNTDNLLLPVNCDESFPNIDPQHFVPTAALQHIPRFNLHPVRSCPDPHPRPRQLPARLPSPRRPWPSPALLPPPRLHHPAHPPRLRLRHLRQRLFRRGLDNSGEALDLAPASISYPCSIFLHEEGKKPMSAADRVGATGSALNRGVGAKAEAAGGASGAPKAKAKAMGAMGSGGAVPMRYMAGGAGAGTAGSAAAPGQSAPRTVLNIVSGKPVPPTQPGAVATSSVGPARGYAKAASSVLTGADAPKVGPPAVAVGRAMAEGRGGVTRDANGKLRVPIGKKYQIIFVTSEVAPFSKTGGLGEAMDGLPIALAALGHRCMVVSPRYDQYSEAWDTSYWSSVPMGGKQDSFSLRSDFADNQARFAYFCKASLKAIQDRRLIGALWHNVDSGITPLYLKAELKLGGIAYGGDSMVVCNDWHSALVPMFIHAEKSTNPSKWQNTKTAFLCHNAVFQGRFVREEGLAEIFGVPQRYIDAITFKQPLRIGKYNEKVSCVNTMAAGLRYSDRALTVSPSYAKEITMDPEKGVELEALFKMGNCTGPRPMRKRRFHGEVGVSPSDLNFVTKTMMSCGPFTAATADAAKRELKNLYRKQNNMTECKGPLMCFIGRLDAQKGYDLLLEALMEVLEDTELQMVVVGAGRADLVAQTKAVEKQYPNKLFYAGWMGAERYALLAGCDYTLLPSRWEPCGLVQMEAMRLGTLPIVAPTGGLKDTVEDGLNGLWTDGEMTVEAIVEQELDLAVWLHRRTREATIEQESVTSLAKALRRACQLFQSEPGKVVEMKKAAMAAAAEFTWSNAALQYEAIFQELGVKDVLPQCGGYATVTLETDKQVGAEVADNLDKVGSGAVLDLSLPRHATERDRERGRACCLCQEPSSATNHVCPACHAWEAAMGLANRAGEALNEVEAFATRAFSSDGSPLILHTEDQAALRRTISRQAQLQVSHCCFKCSAPSSSFDLACSKCSVALCSACVGRLGERPCCPGCKDTEVFNVAAVRFHQSAQQITTSAASLWEGILYLGKVYETSRKLVRCSAIDQRYVSFSEEPLAGGAVAAICCIFGIPWNMDAQIAATVQARYVSFSEVDEMDSHWLEVCELLGSRRDGQPLAGGAELLESSPQGSPVAADASSGPGKPRLPLPVKFMACNSPSQFAGGDASKSQIVNFNFELEAGSATKQEGKEGEVKSTFLDMGDGLSLKKRFRTFRKASTDGNLDDGEGPEEPCSVAETVYEPGTFSPEVDRSESEDSGIKTGATTPTMPSGAEDNSEPETCEEKCEEEEHGEGPKQDSSRKRPRTTVMMRNLPNNYTRSMLLQLLDSRDFAGQYDFVYLPIDFTRRANLGYAFVNLVSEDRQAKFAVCCSASQMACVTDTLHQEAVASFWELFDGFSAWSFPSSKVCEVSWSGPKQGFKAHVDRYKNSPVMHKSVPDEYKPMIFANGVRKKQAKMQAANSQIVVVKSTFVDLKEGLSLTEMQSPRTSQASDAEVESEVSTAPESPKQQPVRPYKKDRAPEVCFKAAGRSTVMMRNVPNNYTREMLLSMLNNYGFSGKYDFVYLPHDFDRSANLGYAFVNLVSDDPASEAVHAFWRKFDGFKRWTLPSAKVCRVSWSGPHQGLAAHVERYRNSPSSSRMESASPSHAPPERSSRHRLAPASECDLAAPKTTLLHSGAILFRYVSHVPVQYRRSWSLERQTQISQLLQLHTA
eukprot:s109_g24.t3